MLQLLMLHACDKLTAGSHKGRPDKKRGFMLGGIFSKLDIPFVLL